MEDQLFWDRKLSLEQMALRRVAVNVWNESDILASIEKYQFKFDFDDSQNMWSKTVENKVKDKVSTLVLPQSLKKEIMLLVRPMGLDVRTWKISHERVLSKSREYFDIRILEQLCHTSAGSIDYRKTVDKLLRLQLLDVEKRYKLACIFCLVDYIPVLWEELPEHYKKNLYDGPLKLRQFFGLVRSKMESYWAFVLNGEESALEEFFGGKYFIVPRHQSFSLQAFEHSACKGNKSATEYFFQRLTDEERQCSLFKTVNAVLDSQISRPELDFLSDKLSDVLFYLLFLMNPEQRMEILKKRPFEVLNRFLNWSCLDLFLDIADVVWTFLPESQYDELQSIIIGKVRSSDYYFSEFLKNFFLRSPKNFRKQFVIRYDYYFCEFFDTEDTDIIKVIFRNVDVEGRMRFVSDYSFFLLLNRLIIRDKWHLAKLCLQEAALSKKDEKEVKSGFRAFRAEMDVQVKIKWRMFFRFSEKTNVSSLNKRSYEGEMLPKAKKTAMKRKRIFYQEWKKETALLHISHEIKQIHSRFYCLLYIDTFLT